MPSDREPRKNEHDKSSAIMPVVAVVGLLATILVFYLAGYYWLATTHYGHQYQPPTGALKIVSVNRQYHYAWQRVLYGPAGFWEARLRKIDVVIEDSDYFELYR